MRHVRRCEHGNKVQEERAAGEEIRSDKCTNCDKTYIKEKSMHILQSKYSCYQSGKTLQIVGLHRLESATKSL